MGRVLRYPAFRKVVSITDKLEVPVCRVVDQPLPESTIKFRTYPEQPRPLVLVPEWDENDDTETKVVRRGRRPKPKATEGAETK